MGAQADNDWDNALEQARDMIKYQEEHEQDHGRPPAEHRKTVYIALGCTNICPWRHGKYHVHYDTLEEYQANMRTNQDMRVIPVEKSGQQAPPQE